MSSFLFQEPGSAKLLHALNAASDGADSGGGVFAFASRGGVNALFKMPALSNLLSRRKPFHLVVGIDAITNAEALLSIADAQAGRSWLTAEVFFHAHPASTFHPKFAWFRNGQDLHLITGSGNLTVGGLGKESLSTTPAGNWEAFSIQVLTGAAAKALLGDIQSWLNANRRAGALRSLDDEEVKAQAMANGLMRYALGRAHLPGTKSSTKEKPRAVPIDDATFEPQDILVRELSENRQGQADIGKGALTEFFGYAGIPKFVLLQHVSENDELGEAKKIRLFVNKSQNYRLELNAISNLQYEIALDGSRMILVATKLDRRSFRYIVVAPGSPAHASLIAMLGPVQKGRRRMREKRTTGDELRKAWRSVPESLLPVATTAHSP